MAFRWKYYPEKDEDETPRTVYKCKCCGFEIVEGDEAYDIDGDVWCTDCIENSLFTARL